MMTTFLWFVQIGLREYFLLTSFRLSTGADLTILLLLELDLEYKYWAFMESHPAHMPLPFNAYADALDALTWSYTGN